MDRATNRSRLMPYSYPDPGPFRDLIATLPPNSSGTIPCRGQADGGRSSVGAMCGRYASSAGRDDLVEMFEIDEVDGPLPGPDFNIAPTDPVPAVLERNRDSRRVRLLTGLRWGLGPSWAKDPGIGARLNNARGETVTVKPAFRSSFARHRCLIPANGFYEWQAVAADGKVRKQP